jgi:hypothetical protein
MASSVVEELERRFLGRLEGTAAQLQAQYPQLKINTWSSSTGSLTEYQGHDVGIDCVNPEAFDDQPNSLCLIIGVMHLTTEPLLSDAQVCWGAGGSGGLDILSEPIPWSDAALQMVDERLPDLVESLRDELNVWASKKHRGA